MVTNSISNNRRVAICVALFFTYANTETRAGEALTVDITTQLGDRQVFAIGDDIRLIYSINAPAHLLAIYQDAEGVLWQLLPSTRFPDDTAKTGRYQAFPAQDSPLRLIAQPPAGRESVWLFASRNRFPTLAGTPGPGGMTRLDTGDIASLQNKLKTQFNIDYAVSRVDYEIRD